jgi:hypothetical protein
MRKIKRLSLFTNAVDLSFSKFLYGLGVYCRL